MVKCTINGQEIEVKEGSTIIEAFKELDQSIAHYCWHPGLSIAGVCRLCMVKIEGNPRLQIACNTVVQEGMVISNQDEDVKETVRWGMDFHLINHPLDCPICDQAGECGLQEQYMEFGKYDPEMAERKVKKRKAQDLGPTVVLDSERCILCSRCVRFTDEVTKTNELGIFNRGDRSEIGTFEGKPLDNKYSLNTVDICPVGALTSKDFRFRQRVWYLQNKETVCPGCSTGCSVKAYYNEEGVFRIKPVYNEEVNGHWMCDEGRDAYKFVNKQVRQLYAERKLASEDSRVVNNNVIAEATAAGNHIRNVIKEHGADAVGLVVTGQYTNEEYTSLLNTMAKDLGVNQVYHWINNKEKFDDFDGILLRGDRNPNTKGLLAALSEQNIEKPWSDLEAKLSDNKIKVLVVAGPEDQKHYPELEQQVNLFAKAENVVYLTVAKNQLFEKMNGWIIPAKSFLEKAGTFINYKGLERKINVVTTIVAGALNLTEWSECLKGEMTNEEISHRPAADSHIKQNYFVKERGQL